MLKRIVPLLLTILFCFISTMSLATIIHMQGNARVINYTGIVRGATQRLVKQELNQYQNDELIDYLEGIITELSTGEGENGLIVLPDRAYQEQMKEMKTAWTELKQEITNVRQNGEGERLFNLSEVYFKMADLAVSDAERYTEKSVRNAKETLICLNVGFVMILVLFWLYQRRQKKVQEALDLAENASRAKSEFLSRISHEIRTPMNGIIGMTAIAKMSVDNREKLIDCLNKIDLSSGYLLGLINDILDMSRIESGKLTLEHEQFEIPEMLDRIYGMFREKAEEGGVEFLVNREGLTVSSVLGDNLRLNQVLINLISNALKFTPSGGRVTLEVCEKAASMQKVDLEFIITDTGIGMSEEFQSRMFEQFEQEQAATARQYGGTGLGLAICSNFVKMMGGQITVFSKQNQGSRFTVHLTFERPASDTAAKEHMTQCVGPEPAAETDLYDLSGIKILLAEDNEINSEIVTVLLTTRGAKVEAAYNGKEAVEKFAASGEGEYSLILMDIQMPVMNGLEAARSIRDLDRKDAGSILIVGLSANAFREDIDKAIQSGMNEYLSKPVNFTRLLEIIRTQMG